MKTKPYEKFSEKELILRDQLAIDRTVLANERTLLSYVRTSLALVAAGGALIHFFTETWVKTTGGLFIILGSLALIIGYMRFRKMDQSIKRVKTP